MQAQSAGRRRLLLAGLVVPLAGPLSGCSTLDERARRAIYRPSRERPDGFAGLAPQDRQWSIAWDAAGSPAQQVQLWWLPNENPEAPALLYLHGTFRNLYRNHPKLLALRAAGFSVLALEYRGWGDSSPLVPSETSIHQDADIGWAELVRLQPDPRRRAIFGHSLGGAVAVHLAARQAGRGAYGGVILESTFTSLPAVAAETTWLAGPLTELTGQRMDARARIGRIKTPLLMLHGTADKTVPFVLGQRLFEAAGPNKAFVAIEGGSHSNLHTEAATLYRQTIAAFAARLR